MSTIKNWKDAGIHRWKNSETGSLVFVNKMPLNRELYEVGYNDNTNADFVVGKTVAYGLKTKAAAVKKAKACMRAHPDG